MGRQLFPTNDAAQILEVPISTLLQWVHHGFISPSVMGERGRGPHQFSIEDLYTAKLFDHIVESGMDRWSSSGITEQVMRESGHRPSKTTIPLSGGKVARILLDTSPIFKRINHMIGLLAIAKETGQGNHGEIADINNLVRKRTTRRQRKSDAA